MEIMKRSLVARFSRDIWIKKKKKKHMDVPLVPDVDSGRTYTCCRQGVYGNSELFTSILQ